jgi:hypothetical protein
MKKKIAPQPALSARGARYGDKMIEARVRFWTDGLAPQKGDVIPKNAWDSGMVAMDSNVSHGIASGTPQPFNSILDLQSVIAEVLVKNGVTLHPNRKSRRLIRSSAA